MSLEPSAHVTDNIRLVRQLGRGGMGSVWVAQHLTLDLEVAVKFIATELLAKSDPLVLTRFRREAQLAAKLDSPHVVRTLDHGVTEDGTPYIVMELLRGECLADRLARMRRIPARDTARILREVAAGLTVAHAAGVVHRDIKPHNIFLATTAAKTEIAKVLDFGVAKTTNTEAQPLATSSGVLIGTPQYMSPEQLMRAGPVDASADLWALSVTAYEMMLGKLPFRGETLAATLVAITRADVEPPSSVDTSLPEALDQWFKRALAIDPMKRFATAMELAESLDAAVEGIVSGELPRPVLALATDATTEATAATAEFVAERELAVPLSRREPALAPTEEATRPAGEAPSAPTPPADATDSAPVTKPSKSDAPPAGSAPARSSPEDSAQASTQTALATTDGDAAPEAASPKTSGGLPRWALGLAGIGAVVAAYFALRTPPAPPRLPSTEPAGASASPTPLPASAPPASAPPASAAPVPTASATAPPLGTIPKTTIASGTAPESRVWLADFAIAREEGDENATFLEAQGACERRAMSLCSDAQWALACVTHPEIASRASWTATAAERGVVVRGGASDDASSGATGCSVRSVVDPTKASPSRMGLCCTRAVGVASTVESPAFLKVTSQKLAEYEKAYDSGNGDRLVNLMDDPVEFHGKTLSHDELPAVVTWMAKQGKLLHDVCDVSIEKVDGQSTWTADCDVLVESPSGLFRGVRRYVRGGENGLVTAVREPKPPVRLGPDDAAAKRAPK